jgi:uncharacterized protein
MNCPRCHHPSLQPRTESGIEIDQCPQCHGLWLDMLELERLLDVDARSLIEDDRRFGAMAGAADSRIHCPRCRGTYMIKINSLVRSGTILDSCTVCFGTWLDAGEYSRLVGTGFWSAVRGLFA